MPKRWLLLILVAFVLVGTATAATLTVNASHDGNLRRSATNEELAVIRAGAGTTVETATPLATGDQAGSVTDRFNSSRKYGMAFPTSTIPDDATIISATVYIRGSSKSVTAGDSALVIFSPANRAAFATVDYSATLWSHANISENKSYADFSTSDYNAYKITDLTKINKTGETVLGLVTTHWMDSTNGTWAAGGYQTYYITSRASSTMPYITVEYTVPASTTAPESIFSDWPWCADQDIFFRNDSSDITGYFHMDHRPQIESTKYLATTVSSGTGSKQIGAWATNASKPGVSVIGPGLWRFRVYLNVSSAVGDTTYEFKVFNRSSDGTETDLFYGHVISKDINDLTPTEHLISYARRNYTRLFSGDRLVIKVNASTSSVAARDAYISIAGNSQASMVGVSYFICENGQAYQLQEAPVSPAVPMVAAAMGILLIGFGRGKKK